MHSLCRIVLIISLLFMAMAGYAQKKGTTQSLSCAAPELTIQQRLELDREAKFALSIKRAAGETATAVTYVPIRPHIFRMSAGTGGIDLAKLNRILAAVNSYYLLNGTGIQFYFAGVIPDYIDSDTYYSSFSMASENTIAGAHDVANAMNLYMVNGFEQSGLGGYAYFPANALYSTRSFILNESDETDLGNRLLPHELGHNFNLYHTFQGSTSSTPELVTRGSGANCTVAGDLVCDTPADPYGRPGATTTYINGCQQYNGTATDPQGASYAPSISNIMSYYFPCTHDFSTGQYDRMAAGLALRQSHTAYTLNYPPTVATAPANLSALLASGGRAVTLNWQDLASNEMGYFVERSTRPMDGFGAVGGTGPNEVTFTDNSVKTNVTYYYRIRPSNTTTGSLSPVVSVLVPGCRPTYVSSCSATNGLASVTINGTTLSSNSGCAVSGYSAMAAPVATVGAGQAVPFIATLLNNSTGLMTTIWADYDRNGTFDVNELVVGTGTGSTGPLSFSLGLPVSLTAGAMPLRIVTATNAPPGDPCGTYVGGEAEDYVLMVTNPATCTAPTALTVNTLTSISAQLSWSVSGTTFAVQYRPAGTTGWSWLDGIQGNSIVLGSLTSGQAYEWQVLTVCGTAGSSPLSAMRSFSTSCSSPTGLSATQVYANTAQLNWAGSAGNTYTVQWRLAGSSTWSVASSNTTNYTLTGLSPNTTYNWQVAINCPSGTSPYSASATVTTNGAFYYCRPASTYGCTEDDGLSGLAIGNFVLSSNSGCSPGAYQSYTAVGATLAPGQTYSFTATLISSVWNEGLAIWGDFNKNGTFDTGEQLYSSPGTLATYIAGSLTLPPGTAPGLYTIRARVVYADIPTDPCAASSYGETEDYVINASASPCTPPSATLTGSQAIYTGQIATLTATIAGPGPWSLAVTNGGSYTGLTTSPFTFTVNPTGTTTYRIAAVGNSCGMGYSGGTAVVTVTVPCNLPTGLGETTITTSYATLFWNPAQPVQYVTSYTVRFREIGTTTWNETTLPASTTATAQYLGSNVYGKGFEWQVQTNCQGGTTAGYSPLRSFSVVCPVPSSLTEVTGITETTLRWTYMRNVTGNSLTYTIQWRPVGGQWNTVANICCNTYNASGLTNGQVYEWRIATQCPEGGLGLYTAPNSFTAQCSIPVPNGTYGTSSTGSNVTWIGPYPATYDVRWRVAGTMNAWTQGAAVTNTGVYSITGLTNATTYDWQVRMSCSGTPTGWSVSSTFTTQCTSSSVNYVAAHTTSVSVSVSEQVQAVYKLEWRLTGTSTWPNSLTNISISQDMYNLIPNTAYELRVTVICADGIATAPSSPYSFTTLPAADLSLILAVDKRVPAVDEVVTFMGTVSNAGPQLAQNVRVQNRMPPNMVYVSSPNAGVEAGQDTVSLVLPLLTVQGSVTYAYSARVTQPGSYRTTAQVTASSVLDPDSYLNSGTADGDDDAATVDLRTREVGNAVFVAANPNPRYLPLVQLNQPVPLPNESDLSIALSSRLRTLPMGGGTTLDISVKNRGGLASASVSVELVIPAGWTVTDNTLTATGANTYTFQLTNLGVDQTLTRAIPVLVAGVGEQTVQTRIFAASQPDSDSSHSNGYGLGEDDEASISIRVR